MRRILVLFVLTFNFLPLASSLAATRFSIINFRPASDISEYVATLGSTPMYKLQWAVGTTSDFSYHAIVESTTSRNIVNYLLVQHIYGAIGIADWLSFGLDFPIGVVNNFADPDTAGSSTTNRFFRLADTRFQFKITILDNAKYPVGLAFVPYMTAPTGDDRRFLGSVGVTGGGLVVVDTDIAGRLNLALNAGAEAHKTVNWRNIDQNNYSLVGGVGASVKITDDVRAVVESYFRSPANHLFNQKEEVPVEIAGAAKVKIGKSGFEVHGGAAGGVVYGAGAPRVRGFAGLSYKSMSERTRALAPRQAKEVNAIVALREKCPADPLQYKAGVHDDECLKYYELKEVAGLIERCPSKPKDFDPKKHSEGCQKIYALADRYSQEDINKVYVMSSVELSEKCPANPSEFNPKIHAAGCPKYYELKDITPLIAACPADAAAFNPKTHDPLCPKVYELKDAYQEEGWMTIAKLSKKDADGDGIADFIDKCPNVSGVKERGGCAEPIRFVAPSGVVIAGEELTTRVPVTFKFDSYEITDESAKMLGEVADKLLSDPGIKTVRIEGYADTTGPGVKNIIYSKQRAAAVKKYLEMHGVDTSRMKVEWHGSTTKFGPAPKNRRVIFIIEK